VNDRGLEMDANCQEPENYLSQDRTEQNLMTSYMSPSASDDWLTWHQTGLLALNRNWTCDDEGVEVEVSK
jgi:hypothetical protein